MVYYVVIAVVGLGLLVGLGVPAIMGLYRIPARVRFRELSEDEVTARALAWFKESDGLAERLGFRVVTTFTLVGHGTLNENRVYWRAEEGTALVASLQGNGGRDLRVLEFTSELDDGTEWSTTNAPVSILIEAPSWQKFRRLPGVHDGARLLEVHRERLARAMSGGVGRRRIEASDLLEEFRRSVHRQLEHQVEAGLFRYDDETDEYRATSEIALRAVAAHLNPFGDEFTWFRLAWGFGLGVLCCVGWAALGGRVGLEGLARELLPEAESSSLLFMQYVPGFVLGGLVAGWAFSSKGVHWGLLVSLPGVLWVISASGLQQPIYFSLAAALSGRLSNVLREGRTGGGRSRVSTAVLLLALVLVAGYYYTG